MNIDQLDHQIEEIEQELLRDDPTLDRQFAQLDRVNRRQDATVFMLLVSSAVFLVIGVATMSMIAWVVGVVSFVAAFSVDTRDERLLRDSHRSQLAGTHRLMRRRRGRARAIRL